MYPHPIKVGLAVVANDIQTLKSTEIFWGVTTFSIQLHVDYSQWCKCFTSYSTCMFFFSPFLAHITEWRSMSVLNVNVYILFIRFTTLKNKRICADPRRVWTMTSMAYLDGKNWQIQRANLHHHWTKQPPSRKKDWDNESKTNKLPVNYLLFQSWKWMYFFFLSMTRLPHLWFRVLCILLISEYLWYVLSECKYQTMLRPLWSDTEQN